MEQLNRQEIWADHHSEVIVNRQEIWANHHSEVIVNRQEIWANPHSEVIVNRQQTSNSVSETQMLLFWLISKLTLSSVSTTRHLMRDVYVIINCVHFLICVIVFNSVCVTHGSLISKLQLSFMLLYINVTHYCIKSNMYNYCTVL